MKTEKAYYKNSDVVKWKRITHSDDYSSEYTYNEQGQHLTYKNSDGYSYEHTYNKQGQQLTYKNSKGYNSERTYNEQGEQLTFKNSSGFSCERTYNEQGQELTFKDSDGIYEIKCKTVTKEEFEAFVNDEIIDVNGIKYKRI
jgi:YD repeat-containing protein